MAGLPEFPESDHPCPSEKSISIIKRHVQRTSPKRASASLKRAFLNCIPFCGTEETHSTSEEPQPHKVKIFRTLTVSTTSTTAQHPSPTMLTKIRDDVPGMVTIQADPYHWPHDASLSPSNTALVIVDMQNDFLMEGGYMTHMGYSIAESRAIIPNCLNLLTTCRALGYPVFFTREGHRPSLSTLSTREHTRSRALGLGIGDLGPLGRLLIRGEKGWEIISELTPLASEEIIDKAGRSAFENTEFRLMLDVKKIQNLIWCGVTTDVCVHSSMRSANDNARDNLLVEDACAAATVELHNGAVESVKAEGGIFGSVAKTDDVVRGLAAMSLLTTK